MRVPKGRMFKAVLKQQEQRYWMVQTYLNGGWQKAKRTVHHKDTVVCTPLSVLALGRRGPCLAGSWALTGFSPGGWEVRSASQHRRPGRQQAQDGLCCWRSL